MKKIKDKLITIYPQLIFLIVTFCIFMPSSLFLGNIDQFAVGFAALIPLLMAASLITAAVVILIGLIVPKKIYNIYAAVIFGGALAAYVQGISLIRILVSLMEGRYSGASSGLME